MGARVFQGVFQIRFLLHAYRATVWPVSGNGGVA